MTRLFAPVKDLQTLRQVFNAGADMAYAGIDGFCRRQSSSVNMEQLTRLSAEAKKMKISLIAALNLVPSVDRESDIYPAIEQSLLKGADGVILNDAGIIHRARKRFPGIFIMASAGISALNSEDADFLYRTGADAVFCSEFLTSLELSQIREKTAARIEIFGLGIKEFCYTGRCAISEYFRLNIKNRRFSGSPKRGGLCYKPCMTSFSHKNGITSPLPSRRINLLQAFESYARSADIIKLSPVSDGWDDLLIILSHMAEKLKSNRETP